MQKHTKDSQFTGNLQIQLKGFPYQYDQTKKFMSVPPKYDQKSLIWLLNPHGISSKLSKQKSTKTISIYIYIYIYIYIDGFGQ